MTHGVWCVVLSCGWCAVRSPPTMESAIDLLIETTDPVTAILLAVLIYHVRKIETRLSEDIARVRSRVERLEEPHIPDAYDYDFDFSRGHGDDDSDPSPNDD